MVRGCLPPIPTEDGTSHREPWRRQGHPPGPGELTYRLFYLVTGEGARKINRDADTEWIGMVKIADQRSIQISFIAYCRSYQIDQMDHLEFPFVRRIHGPGKGVLAARAPGGKD
jgi:hypothetical protein